MQLYKAGLPCSSFCGCGNQCSNKQDDGIQDVNLEDVEDFNREDYDEDAKYDETDYDTDYEDD